MRRPRPPSSCVVPLLAAGFVAFAASPARADAFVFHDGSNPATVLRSPLKGEGFIGAGGGGRWVWQDDFIAALGRHNAIGVTARDPVLPAVVVPFGYVVDQHLAVVVEGGYAMDRFSGAGRRIDVGTLSLVISGQYLLDVGIPWVQPYGTFGLGVWLSTFTGLDATKPSSTFESNTQGGFAGLGARFALGGGFGISTEFRLSIAEALVTGTGIAQVGGVQGLLGVYYAWKQ